MEVLIESSSEEKNVNLNDEVGEGSVWSEVQKYKLIVNHEGVGQEEQVQRRINFDQLIGTSDRTKSNEILILLMSEEGSVKFNSSEHYRVVGVETNVTTGNI